MKSYSALLSAATPPWLAGPWGQKWVEVLARSIDSLVVRAKVAILARLPAKAPRDALPLLGGNRGVDRAPGESDDAYASRLESAWLTWKYSGTDMGVLEALRTSGIGITVSTIGTLDGIWSRQWPLDGHVWLFPRAEFDDGSPSTHWSQFFLLWDGFADRVWSDGSWNSPGVWGDGGVWGFDISLNPFLIEWLRTVIRKWKGSHSTCPRVYVVESPGGWADAWAPTGGWGDEDDGDWGGDISMIPIGEKR